MSDLDGHEVNIEKLIERLRSAVNPKQVIQLEPKSRFRMAIGLVA